MIADQSREIFFMEINKYIIYKVFSVPPPLLFPLSVITLLAKRITRLSPSDIPSRFSVPINLNHMPKVTCQRVTFTCMKEELSINLPFPPQLLLEQKYQRT